MAVEASTRRRFPRITSAAFEHPADRQALEALRKIPVLDKVFKKMMELGVERFLRVELMGSAIHVTPKQCPKVYKLFKEAADILDMNEPDLFLVSSPFVNAMTVGIERPIIIMWSGLVDLLTEDELMSVLGHELGHVKAGHVLYLTIAFFLKYVIEKVFGLQGSLASTGLRVALLDWERKAELTADRAELLVMQNLPTCLSVHMKLAGGSKAVYAQTDVDEFLRQGESYEDIDYDALNKFYKLMIEMFRTHPVNVHRAREIKAWSESRQYKEIMQGRYPTEEPGVTVRACPHCGAKVSPSFFFCPDCGKSTRI